MERLRLRIDQADALSVPEQIARHIASWIIDGVLLPGDRLPPSEHVAKTAGIGRKATVLAYQMLARNGITINATGLGTTLSEQSVHAARRFLLSLTVAALVHHAQSLELGEDDIVGVVLAALRPVDDPSTTKTGRIGAEEA